MLCSQSLAFAEGEEKVQTTQLDSVMFYQVDRGLFV